MMRRQGRVASYPQVAVATVTRWRQAGWYAADIRLSTEVGSEVRSGSPGPEPIDALPYARRIGVG